VGLRKETGFDQGAILVTTLYIIMLVLLTTATLAAMGATESLIAVRQVHASKAVYLAEAGIQSARARLMDDPGILGSADSNYAMSFESGVTRVTIANPSRNDFITVKAKAELANGAVRTLEAAMSAPPAYVVYCRELTFNQVLDILTPLNSFGIPPPPGFTLPDALQGALVLDPGSQGAFQKFTGSDAAFPESNRTGRYCSSIPEMRYFQRLDDFRGQVYWGPYSYCFYPQKVAAAPQCADTIIVSARDVMIYSDDSAVNLENCYVVAGGDIWVINLGDGDSNISGAFWAGGSIHLYQLQGAMSFRGSICSANRIDLCTVSGNIYMTHDPVYVTRTPAALRGKLGFLSFKSWREVYN
jgi:hypothetical protein